MQIIKTAKSYKLVMSQKDWMDLGRRHGWIKKAQEEQNESGIPVVSFDFDGTLALFKFGRGKSGQNTFYYDGPNPKAVEQLKQHLKKNHKVVIVSARSQDQDKMISDREKEEETGGTKAKQEQSALEEQLENSISIQKFLNQQFGNTKTKVVPVAFLGKDKEEGGEQIASEDIDLIKGVNIMYAESPENKIECINKIESRVHYDDHFIRDKRDISKKSPHNSDAFVTHQLQKMTSEQIQELLKHLTGTGGKKVEALILAHETLRNRIANGNFHFVRVNPSDQKSDLPNIQELMGQQQNRGEGPNVSKSMLH